MISIHRLTDRLAVAPQPAKDDFQRIAAAGFRTVINNRPDGEEQGQLGHEDAAEAARQAGLAYHYLPVNSGEITAEDLAAFARLLNESKGSVLAYCRSGMRSTMLWALTQTRRAPDEVLETAREAGYDLSSLRPRLEAPPAASLG